MFDKFGCILCLENTSDKQINMDSDELQAVNARDIIKQHFKEEVLSVMSFLINKVVCCQCWELVQSFHEFYLRVQSAHFTASRAMKSLQELEIPITEIKAEPHAVDELASPPSIFQSSELCCVEMDKIVVELKNEGEVTSTDDDKIVGVYSSNEKQQLKTIEELEIPPTRIEVEHHVGEELASSSSILQSSPTVLKKFGAEIDKIVEDLKSEGEGTDSTDDDNNISNITCNDEKNPLPAKREVVRNKIKAKRKHQEPTIVGAHSSNEKQRLKTIEYDEFIAKNFKLTCFLCQKSLVNFRELKIHYREEHKTNGYVKCCGKKLLKRGILVDHIHFHNDPEYFKCQHCDKVFCDRGNLESHLKYFHDSKERTAYKCEICSKVFFWHKVLVRHYQVHSTKEEQKVKCTQCEKTFVSEYHMKQHLNLYHLRLYAKICDICGKSFTGGEAFRRHQQEHAGLPRSKVKCEICNTELSTKNGLAQHIKAMHTEEYQKPQVCSVCSKISPTLRSHITHFRNMHATKKMHVCKICDKTFKRPTNLREHMATHTHEALYTCTFCPQTFKSNANMYKHRKQKHPQEWSEKCLKKNITTEMVNKIVGLQYSKDPDPTRTGCAGFPGHD